MKRFRVITIGKEASGTHEMGSIIPDHSWVEIERKIMWPYRSDGSMNPAYELQYDRLLIAKIKRDGAAQ